MTKKRISELYRFLAVASMKRLTDEEKVAFIRLLRKMKPVFTEIQDAANDALEQAKKESQDQSAVFALVEKSMQDLSQQECDCDVRVMNDEMFNRLCLSNDWSFAQIDELEAELVIG